MTFRDCNPAFLIGICIILFATCFAIALVGVQKPAIPEEYTWMLPIRIIITFSTLFFLGYIAGRKDKRNQM